MLVIDKLLKEKIVAVVRAENKEKAYEISKAIIKGGIKAIEITFTIPDAELLISQMNEEFGEDTLIGAGTVIDIVKCKKAIDHGAQYIVSPGFDKECAKYCYEKEIPYMPGCMTVTEIMTALKYHVKVIKLFPGDHFGPKFIKNIKAPLPDIQVMVTGGVNLKNMNEWFANGADLVGIGGALTKAYKPNDLKPVTEISKQYVDKLKEVK